MSATKRAKKDRSIAGRCFHSELVFVLNRARRVSSAGGKIVCKKCIEHPHDSGDHRNEKTPISHMNLKDFRGHEEMLLQRLSSLRDVRLLLGGARLKLALHFHHFRRSRLGAYSAVTKWYLTSRGKRVRWENFTEDIRVRPRADELIAAVRSIR